MASSKSAMSSKVTIVLPLYMWKNLEEALNEYVTNGKTGNEQLERSKLLRAIVNGEDDW